MILDGKLVSGKIKEELKEECEKYLKEYKRVPSLAVVFVGTNKASEIYVNNKIKACEKVGIKSQVVRIEESTTTQVVVDKIKKLAADNTVDGIMVQLPLPDNIDKEKVLNEIPYDKDVDGLTLESVGRLASNKEGFVPCTPKGVCDLLDYYKIEVSGKNVVIIGRSMLVGKPLSFLLTNKNATVTLCHSKTKDIKKITKQADIIVCAIGKANYLKKDFIKKNVVIVDVGINKIDSKIMGDVDYKECYKKASYITPVPGGCGPMTVAELLKNTCLAFINHVRN